MPQNNTFIFINNYIYIFSEKGEIILKNKFLNESYLEYYQILFQNNYTIKKANVYYYYFLFLKKSNGIIGIDIFEYNYSSNLNNILFNHVINTSNLFKEKFTTLEDNFSCEFMSRKNFKDKLLTCFLENENQIISKVYKINIEKKQIFLFSQKTADIKLNKKTGKIKVFISEDKEKSLICNYENFSYYNCIIYDANKNIFSRYNNYLNNCQNSMFSLNLIFMKEIKQYAFYCLNFSNELNYAILNEDLEIEKNYTNKNNNISKYIKPFISNISYNNVLKFLTKKNLDYNIGIKNNYANINNRQLENNNEESNQEEKIPEKDNNQNGDQGSNEGQDGQNESNPNDNKEDNKDDKDDKEEKQGQDGNDDKNFDFDFEKGKTNMTREEIRENRGNIMENYEPGKSYTMQGYGFDIKVAPMGEKEEGTTYIDFQSCEAKLREEYGLNESAVLSVFQTQITSTNEKSITNKVQYVVYDENNNELNLSVCNDEKIKINYAIRNDTTLDTTKLKNFGDKGIDILNSSDPFFNDICYSYSTDDGSDMILKDRISGVSDKNFERTIYFELFSKYFRNVFERFRIIFEKFFQFESYYSNIRKYQSIFFEYSKNM